MTAQWPRAHGSTVRTLRRPHGPAGRVLALTLGLLVLVSSCNTTGASTRGGGAATETSEGSPSVTSAIRPDVTEWVDDIEYLAEQIAGRHISPFHTISREDFAAEVDSLVGRIPTLSDVEIAFEIRRLVALIGDAHTSADTPLDIAAYPIGVERFDDGVVVIATSADHTDLLGTTLTAVHGLALDDILQAGTAYFSGDSDEAKLVEVARFAVSPEFVDIVGDLAETVPGVVTLTRNGTPFDVFLEPVSLDGWSSVVVHQVAHELPISARRPNDCYWFTLLPDSTTMFLQYNVCGQNPDVGFADFTSDVFATIDSENVDRLVVDLRRNDGGDSSVMAPLIEGLVGHPIAQEGRVYVLIGAETFSSAVINAIQLRDDIGATLIGRPTKSNANHYGELDTFTLPNSGIRVGCATRFFELSETDTRALEPAIDVPRLSTDYFAGVDAALDTALALP